MKRGVKGRSAPWPIVTKRPYQRAITFKIHKAEACTFRQKNGLQIGCNVITLGDSVLIISCVIDFASSLPAVLPLTFRHAVATQAEGYRSGHSSPGYSIPRHLIIGIFILMIDNVR